MSHKNSYLSILFIQFRKKLPWWKTEIVNAVGQFSLIFVLTLMLILVKLVFWCGIFCSLLFSSLKLKLVL